MSKKIDPIEDPMYGCEFCGTWFHEFCLKLEDFRQQSKDRKIVTNYQNYQTVCKMPFKKPGKDWRCPKCKHWVEVMNQASDFLLLKEKKVAPIKEDMWDLDWKPKRLLLQVELTLVEQILLARIWYSLSKQQKVQTVSNKQMVSHMADSKLIVFNMSKVNSQINHSSEPSTSVSNSAKQSPKIFNSSSASSADIEMEKYKSIVPLEVITEDGHVDQMRVNENRENLKKLTGYCINQRRFGSGSSTPQDKIGVAFKKLKKFNHAFEIIEGRMTIPMGDVENLLVELDQLGLRQMRTIDKLAQIFQFKLKMLQDIEQKLIEGQKADIQAIRKTLEDSSDSQEQSLSQKRDNFKSLLANKTTSSHFNKLLGRLKEYPGISNEEDTEIIKSLINDTLQLEDRVFEFMVEEGQDPLTKLHELLIQLCARPIKFDSADRLVELYHRSALWQEKANAFVKATSETITKINPEEKTPQGKDLPQPPKYDFCGIQSLVSTPLQAKQQGKQHVDKMLLYDRVLFNRVVAKASQIKKLRDKVQGIQSMTLFDVLAYKQEMEQLAAVDFSQQLQQVYGFLTESKQNKIEQGDKQLIDDALEGLIK